MPENSVGIQIEPGANNHIHQAELIQKIDKELGQVKRPDFSDVMGQSFTQNDKGDFQLEPSAKLNPVNETTPLTNQQKAEFEDFNLIESLKEEVEKTANDRQSWLAKFMSGNKGVKAVRERLAKLRTGRNKEGDINGSTN
jgi:hypothetical protein